MDADLSKLRIERGDQRHGRREPRLPIFVGAIVVIVLLAIAGGSVYFSNSNSEPVRAAGQTENKAAAQSSQTQVAAAPLSRAGVLDATGYVVAQRQAAVASQATGRLVALHVEEGDVVKAGDVLGQLESEVLQANVRDRQAQVALADARTASAEAELADATRERNRMVALEKEQVESQRQADTAVTRFLKAQADLAGAKANRMLADAQLTRATVELSYADIKAPFDGTVLSKNAEVGEIVAPMGSSLNARAAIVTIADMNSLQVEADVSESNLQKIFLDGECEITLDSLPGKVYHGKVSKIVPTVDRAKATVLTKIIFLDRDAAVIPEMSAKIAFKLKR